MAPSLVQDQTAVSAHLQVQNTTTCWNSNESVGSNYVKSTAKHFTATLYTAVID